MSNDLTPNETAETEGPWPSAGRGADDDHVVVEW